MKRKIYIRFLSLFLLLGMITACSDDYLDTQPTTSISEAVVFESYEGALSLLDGTYRFMHSFSTNETGRHDDFGQKAIDLALDLMGGDLAMPVQHWYASDNNFIYTERYDYSRTHMIWNFYYDVIYSANKVIENVDNIPNLEDERRNNLIGQAFALRAWAHYYLVRLYQHTYIGHQSDLAVPLKISTSLEDEPKATVGDIYSQIVADLEAAVTALGNSVSREHKSHVNLNVAQGIYADVALTMNNWEKAEEMAHAARNGYVPMSVSEYTSGFNNLSNNEWMWGFEINSETSSIYASFFSHMDAWGGGYASIGVVKNMSWDLYSQISANDIRATVDVDPAYGYFPLCQTKFKAADGAFLGDYIMMRAAEMYLIEAEALAEQGKDATAQDVLFELVSTRDPDYVKSVNTGAALINEVLLQKRIELFAEGRKFLDLKRRKLPLDRLENFQYAHPSWARIYHLDPEDDHFIYPIPELEIDVNDNVDIDN